MSSDLGDKDCHAHLVNALKTARDAATSMGKPVSSNIIIFGSDRKSFVQFVQSMKSARDACRGIALTRPDYELAANLQQWLQLARFCQEAADRAEKMFVHTASSTTRFAWLKVAKQLDELIQHAQKEFNRSVASRRMQG